MQHQATSLVGNEEIGITFTEKAITPWGGLVLFGGLAKQIGLEDALRKALPFNPTSPNATDPVEIILAFMAGVLVGSRRLAHIERLRWDEGVRTILGVKCFVSDTMLRVSLAGPWRTQFERALQVFFPRVNVNCASVGTG